MTVFLVGAGPGDPGLLTVRGREVLGEADVVLYDALVDARLLGLSPRQAVLVDVGKAHREAGHATSQEAINELLVHFGRQAETVVRLKGGDPLIFGRGGEEALALAAARIPFEIVPGVSSAIAAPAYAGIPVTHRGLASSVAIVTGHDAPSKQAHEARVDWARLATAADTLVILMGVATLPRTVAQLIDHGRPAHTPAAIIEQATTGRQRVVAGDLCDLPALAARAAIRSPAVIVVGEVVRLRATLDWFARPTPSERATGNAGPAAPEEVLACA